MSIFTMTNINYSKIFGIITILLSILSIFLIFTKFKNTANIMLCLNLLIICLAIIIISQKDSSE